MPRTLVICWPTASVAGGVQTWMRELAGGLDRGRWRTVVALLRGAVAHDPARFEAANPGLETVVIDGRGLDARARVREVRRCLRRVRPDVFLPLTSVDAHDAICAAKSAGEPARYVMSIPGNVPAQIADARGWAGFVDLAVCPGRLTCRLVEWAGVPTERIRHVPNGARTPLKRREPRPSGEPIRLGYVGRLSRGDKRVMDMVALSRELQARGVPHRLRIAGEGPMRTELEAGLEGRAEFLGRLDLDTLYERVYPQLDVLMLFSESEAFGIAVVEAMHHSVVPVTSRFVGHGAEGILVDGHTALLFPVGDMATAAAHIQTLSAQPRLLEILSARGRDAVQRYTWPACVAGWSEALDDVLARTPRMGTRPPAMRTGAGRLERLGFPPSLVDSLRRARIRLGGVPPAMRGGEEWPWIGRHHQTTLLQEIESISRALDRKDDATRTSAGLAGA